MEKIIKEKLIERGFKKSTLLNNRGLIGATIDETISQLQIGGNGHCKDDLRVAFEQARCNNHSFDDWYDFNYHKH